MLHWFAIGLTVIVAYGAHRLRRVRQSGRGKATFSVFCSFLNVSALFGALVEVEDIGPNPPLLHTHY